jgi:hypothetical protein
VAAIQLQELTQLKFYVYFLKFVLILKKLPFSFADKSSTVMVESALIFTNSCLVSVCIKKTRVHQGSVKK